MADCSKNKNPLIRSGINRSQRFLAALNDKYVVPDERNFEDWLVYARNLAAHIKYYNSNNTEEGNWQSFFEADVSAQLALIAVQDVNNYKDYNRALFDSILSKDLQNNIAQLSINFGLLFSGVLSLAYRLDHFGKILPEEVPLKRTIANLTLTKLSPALRRLLGYYKAALDFYTPVLIDETEASDWTILGAKQVRAADIIAAGLTDKWIFKYEGEAATDFNDYYTNIIAADKTIYNHDAAVVVPADFWPVLNHATNHNLFSAVFADFLSAYARIVKDARQQLIKTITQQNDHEPHIALYLTFLHLFKHAQGEMNSYTKRHLDFYYKDVLRLEPKKSEPNHVFLTFELATIVQEYLLKKGTAFKAGKDSAGKEAIYKSDTDLVINRATVAMLRSFYRASSLDKIGANSLNGMLYASSVANSADGAGAKLTTESKDWHPFANKLFTDGELAAINMPQATIGFALASHYLFLKEGKRKITITLHGTSLNKLAGKEFTCYLTTEKSWLEKTVFTISSFTTSAIITITIDPADPAITAFVQKVHLDNFVNVDTPIVKFTAKNVAGKNQYDDLKDVTISSIDIKVNVGDLDVNTTTGMKELLISSDFGSVDPSKPFIPFGQNPKEGAGLVFGNKELFSKKGAKLTLSITWAELTENIKDMDYNLENIFFPSAQLKFLQSGVWKDGDFTSILNVEHTSTAKGELELFWGKDFIMMADIYLPSSPVMIPDDSIVDYQDEYSPYNISSQRGFFKLQLNADFQFDKYFSDLQLYLIQVANKEITGDDIEKKKPIPPYIPKIQSAYLSYEATTSINFSGLKSSTGKFVHLYPFGTDEIDSTNIISSKVTLMPQFTHKEVSATVHNIAEFYIGLKDLVPTQKVSLLFKVLEGSTNPLQGKPEKHVFWSYLSNNLWIDFKESEISDATKQLIETGITTFSMPEAATSANTVLPSGYHWLKASIKEMPEQVCKLIDVKAQVVQATFYDQQNAEDFLQLPLPPGTISKLQAPDPAIKKIEQPYASFGGRYREDAINFYTRVSERLRHKNRAITIRDFEQLILEAFPDIHKVKCLNHTRLELLPTKTIYNEQSPGHVTVITIPDLHNKNAINPLRPYTNRDRLEEIRLFLEKRSNCNMIIHVENPVFEEVRVEVVVVLTDAAAGNNTFYEDLLKQELVQFLTPWAYDLNTDINFGGRITQSNIINFIEERSYIDFILDLKMFHNKMDGTPESGNKDEIIAATARSILVSAPAAKHTVVIIAKPPQTDNSECK